MINRVGIAYAVAMLLSAAASFGKWFLFARILGADAFSYYAMLDLVASYGLYIGGFGIFDGASRLVPMLRGGGRHRAARLVAVRATGELLVLSLLALGLFALVIQLNVGDTRLSTTLVFAGIFAVFSNLFLMGTMLLLAFGRPLAFALAMLAKNVGVLVAGAVLGTQMGLQGVIASELCVTALIAMGVFAIQGTPGRFRLRHLTRWSGAFRPGLPLTVSSLVQNITRNADRLLVGLSLGILAFGQYSFSLIIATAGLLILSILNQYISPKIYFAFGAKANLQGLIRRMDVLVIATLLAAAGAFAPFLWLIERVGLALFPDFALGLSLMPIIFFAAALQVAQLYQGFLIARGEGWRLVRQGVIVAGFALTAGAIGLAIEAPAEFFAYVFIGHRLLSAVMLRVAVSRPAEAADTDRSRSIKAWMLTQSGDGGN
jgi:O-antigen/teichoic acid export membrane protein